MIKRQHKSEPLKLTREQIESIKNAKKEGLGDKVEKVAKPIAKAIDYIAGTNIQNCGGCKKRKEALNKLFSGDT